MTTKADTTTTCRPCRDTGWHDCSACEEERHSDAGDGTCALADLCKYCGGTGRAHCENCNADGEREDVS